MIRLRAFLNDRLSAAAMEIFTEVEKIVAVYQAEVARSRDEIGLLEKELNLLKEKDGDSPEGDSAVIKEEQTVIQDESPGPSPLFKEEACSIQGYELPGTSQADIIIEANSWDCSSPQTSDIIKLEEGFDTSAGEMEVGVPPVMVRNDYSQLHIDHGWDALVSDGVSSPSANNDNGEGQDRESYRGCKRQKSRMANFVMPQNEKNDPMESDLSNHNSPEKPQGAHIFCHLCGKSFQYVGSLMKHIKSHKTKSCTLCGHPYQSSKEHITHLKMAHSKVLFCDICGKIFTQRLSLTKHLKIHAVGRPFKCLDCGKTFGRKEHLDIHIRTHSGEKPYHCDICGKAFSQSQNVTIHKRSHTGEKPYHCDLCGKLFTTKSQLKTHLRYHSGEKPYTCSFCGKSFCQNGQMRIHLRTHTGERPYACNVCGMQYKFAPNLKEHMKSHEREPAE